ncbi:succinyl-diaminopimelate desuccinylase [Kineosporia sp. J2-2]|uniref:Succinyl-diaminopimelate desuccinylase n=1 Tax=Kineosporia corallincola TaxID=2835133 RepID=A0ABS5TH50_9ACTN|nr:succinyl-diaminopimelate desuccinylase [Kineosporia corallincola]MBT0770420.1 succinyl-diaminopimelate desuccinylase [Kineosporia corallincola]
MTDAAAPVRLDLTGDIADLTRALCDIPSVSGDEQVIADAIEAALRGYPHLEVIRDGHCVIARTHLGRAERVVLAGHIDTVPIAGNLPTRTVDGVIHGRGTVDMKGGVAVALALAAGVPEPTRDVTYVFYDCEEIEAVRNGLGRLSRTRPELLRADFAVLGEPTSAVVEGGCQGTMRIEVTTTGTAAHSARSWMGSNAIHHAGQVLDVLNRYAAQQIEVDGLVYREGLNAVGISGGIAGNVIPDRCSVLVNYRFAPDKTLEQAEAHLRDLFAGFEITVTDASPAARPGLNAPVAAGFVAAVGGTPGPKYGWTDVALFSTLGVPAVNFGPGDPSLAHKDDERCPVSDLTTCLDALRRYLLA